MIWPGEPFWKKCLSSLYLQKQDDGTFKPKLIPTDDAERPDQNFLSTLQPGQLFKPMEGFTPSVSLPENE